jgi:hypothetical protein
MSDGHDPLPGSADTWLQTIFSAKAVRRGAVVRRSAAWVEREVGRERFIDEVRRRGFHMVESGGQLIVICNGTGWRVVC